MPRAACRPIPFCEYQPCSSRSCRSFGSLWSNTRTCCAQGTHGLPRPAEIAHGLRVWVLQLVLFVFWLALTTDRKSRAEQPLIRLGVEARIASPAIATSPVKGLMGGVIALGNSQRQLSARATPTRVIGPTVTTNSGPPWPTMARCEPTGFDFRQQCPKQVCSSKAGHHNLSRSEVALDGPRHICILLTEHIATDNYKAVFHVPRCRFHSAVQGQGSRKCRQAVQDANA